MNFKNTIIFTLVLSGLTTVVPSHSLSLLSGIKSGVGALVAGGAAFGVAQVVNERLEVQHNCDRNYALVAFSTILASYAGWKIVFRYTPEGRLARARSELASLSPSLLSIMQKYEYDEVSLRKTLHEEFVAHPFPLVTAYHEMQNVRKAIINAQGLIQAAKEDQDSQSPIAYECQELFDETVAILQTTGRVLIILTSSLNWIAMFSAHNAAQLLQVQKDMLTMQTCRY